MTTALVLEAGRQILTNENIELDEVIDNIYTTYDEYVATVRNQLTKDVKLENITNDEKNLFYLFVLVVLELLKNKRYINRKHTRN